MLTQDKNFDELAENFADRIYGGAKGDWRLTILREDLKEVLDKTDELAVFDAACGFAQFALELAEKNHQLTLCDISEKLLSRAKADFAAKDLAADFHQARFQDLSAHLGQFDLVLNHAVLEWLAEPYAGLEILLSKVKSGGLLSLMFYNRNAMVYKNILRGGWRLKPILTDEYIGKGHKLSPPNPLFPHEVIDFVENHGMQIIRHTGVRVFHDYLDQQTLADSDEAELFALEQRYCRMPTYRDMGRYVHLLLRKA